MASDVAQWLIEIRTLQRQLVETNNERDAAFKSAANWRRLYETEAKQRRAATQRLQDSIDELKRAIAALSETADDATVQEQAADPNHSNGSSQGTIPSDLAQLDREHLLHRLAESMAHCDCLSRSLQAEQLAHEQTRNSLTMALGDTISMFSSEPS